MAELGCKVRTFDFFVNTTDQVFRSHPNIAFTMVGLSHYRGMREMGNKINLYPPTYALGTYLI